MSMMIWYSLRIHSVTLHLGKCIYLRKKPNRREVSEKVPETVKPKSSNPINYQRLNFYLVVLLGPSITLIWNLLLNQDLNGWLGRIRDLRRRTKLSILITNNKIFLMFSRVRRKLWKGSSLSDSRQLRDSNREWRKRIRFQDQFTIRTIKRSKERVNLSVLLGLEDITS